MTAPPPRSPGRLTCLLTAVLLAGCGRKTEHGEAPPEPSNVAPASSSRTPLDLSSAFASADLRVEARRGLVDRGEPLLEPHRQILERHFGGAPPLPLAFQAAASGGDRVAVLLQATAGEARPLVLLLTRAGEVVWSKDHPMGGVKPGASEPAIASGPNGHVALAWCNASTKSVALREWADDGGAFADYEAMHFDTCDALSVLYWPKRGWVIGVAWQFGAILQRLSENGETVWGLAG